MKISKRWPAGLALAGVLPFAATTAFADDIPLDPDDGQAGVYTSPSYPPASGLPPSPAAPVSIADVSMLQSEDVGGAALLDGYPPDPHAIWRRPCPHTPWGPQRLGARGVQTTMADGHRVYEGVFRFADAESAAAAAIALQGDVAHCPSGHLGHEVSIVAGTDQWGVGSTWFTIGNTDDDRTDTYLVAPVGDLVISVLDTGTAADEIGDLAVVADLGAKTMVRAATEVPPVTAAPTLPAGWPPLPDLANPPLPSSEASMPQLPMDPQLPAPSLPAPNLPTPEPVDPS